MNSREMARRQSSPYTGKFSARPAGQRGEISSFWRICDDSFPPLRRCSCKHNTKAPRLRFQGMAESIWSDVVSESNPNPGAEPAASRRTARSPGSRTCREDHVSSSADEFRPAIPRSGWSPPEPVSASPAPAE